MIDHEKDISAFLFYLYRCAITFKTELNKVFLIEFKEGLTVDFWFVLSVLWENDNIPQGIIADRLNRDRASISRTLDGMEEKGLIKRLTDASDKRESKICLTKSAFEIKDKANEIALQQMAKHLNGLSPIEVKELIRMLNHIYTNIKK